METSRLYSRLVFFWLTAILLFAPLVRGGNRQLALMGLLGLSLALLATLLAAWTLRAFGNSTSAHRRPASGRPDHPRWRWVLLVGVASSPIWLGAIQLFPLDQRLWSSLSGREAYVTALTHANLLIPSRLPLSLNPMATWAAMWAGVPIAVTFVAALLIDRRTTELLFAVLLGAAIVQISVALLQFVQGPGSFFYFDSAFQGYRFIGTFNNRNHLADFFAMLIPIWFYFFSRQYQQSDSNFRFLPRPLLRPLWLLLGFVIVVMILSSQSRGGLIASSTALILSTLIFLGYTDRTMRMPQRIWIMALLCLFALAAVLVAGVTETGARLVGGQLSADADVRNIYTLSTMKAAQEYWPWGSGMGTFESAFPRFQDIRSIGYIEYAHNDYAQLVMELGAPVLLIIGALAILTYTQLVSLRSARAVQGSISSERLLHYSALIGLIAMLVHSWVEFNMHIPALSITAAFFMGTFLRPISPSLEQDP